LDNLQKFVFTRTYAKWDEENGRREEFSETVDRYVSFISSERDIPENVLSRIRYHMDDLGVMPSMRGLWSAGGAARNDNTMLYNCAFVPIDSVVSFAEALYILMMGTGVGYSVEREFVSNLPTISKCRHDAHQHIIVPDSTTGWADSLKLLMTSLYQGKTVSVDYSHIRPAGAQCKTKGGRSSGPKPLIALFEFIERVMKGAEGNKLSTLECSDIMCMIGEIVMAGGVRRAALICFSDPDDEEMRDAKKFPVCDLCGGMFGNDLTHHLKDAHGVDACDYSGYIGFGAHRFMVNISSFWQGKPSRDVFNREWASLVASGSGERGFFSIPATKKAERGEACRSNPCGEILLRFSRSVDPWTGEGGGGQFCNLSAAIMRADDTPESFAEKVEVATWIGSIQSSFTHFPYLRPAWEKHCKEDRLLGVDITGHCDNPGLSGDVEAMLMFNKIARQTAIKAAKHLGINAPASITCGKPSGNSSQMVNCASGFHARFSPFYIRRVRISSDDPLCHLMRDQGIDMKKDTKYKHGSDEDCKTWVAEFPVASPVGCVTRDDETALEQLERYLVIMDTWCGDKGHNQSATVYVRENEWNAVGEWLFHNFDKVTGLSFLPYDGGSYELAPYEEISEETYHAMCATTPDIDYTLLGDYEQEYRGTGAKELACVGGACELSL